MGKKINLTKSPIHSISFLSNDEAWSVVNKGWSLSYVYSLVEIRDIYLLLENLDREYTVEALTNKFVIGTIPYAKKPWDNKGRRVLEIINALVNFGLIDSEKHKPVSSCFERVEPGTPLSQSELDVFRNVFFNYFRFKEFASLFVSPELSNEQRQQITKEEFIERSHPLFCFTSLKGYTDSFFYELSNDPPLYMIQSTGKQEENNGGLLRFWDVFISWGLQLGVLSKFNMRNAGYKLANEKTFACCYFISSPSDIDVHEHVLACSKGQKCIDIADIILSMCLKHRVRVDVAQQLFIDYYKSNEESLSLVRTSEIFIKETEFNKYDVVLYPKYKDSFVSHIIIR